MRELIARLHEQPKAGVILLYSSGLDSNYVLHTLLRQCQNPVIALHCFDSSQRYTLMEMAMIRRLESTLQPLGGYRLLTTLSEHWSVSYLHAATVAGGIARETPSVKFLLSGYHEGEVQIGCPQVTAHTEAAFASGFYRLGEGRAPAIPEYLTPQYPSPPKEVCYAELPESVTQQCCSCWQPELSAKDFLVTKSSKRGPPSRAVRRGMCWTACGACSGCKEYGHPTNPCPELQEGEEGYPEYEIARQMVELRYRRRPLPYV